MSNEFRTTVTISRAELQRLQREVKEASSLREQIEAMRRLQDAIERENREYRRTVENMREQINASVRAISAIRTENIHLRNEMINSINRQNQRMEEMAARHQQEMEEMSREFARNISSVRDELHDTAYQIVQEMDRQRQELESQMQDMERDLRSDMSAMQSQIDAVDQTVQAMQRDDAALADMARTYADAVDAIIRELQEHRTEQFFPGRLQGLSASLDNINSDLSSGRHGVGAAARAEARQLFSDTMALRQEVLMAEQRWELQRQIAIQIIDRVSAQIEASRQIAVEGETDALDVDHWSHGALSHLQGLLEEIRREADNRNRSIEQMEELQDAAAEISREVSDTTLFAAAAFRSSCDRYDLIADLERELFDGENGVLLQLDDDAYQGDDPRAGFRARLTNPQTGLEMAVTLRPEIGEDGQPGNSFTYDVESNGTHNAAFADSILDHIMRILASHGLTCSPPERLVEGDSRCNAAATRFNVDHWRNEEAVVPAPPRKETRRAPRTGGNAGQGRGDSAARTAVGGQ